jgi:predicted DNA binding CopG/RHH family protein
MSMVKKIPGSAENWENGELGLNKVTAKVVTQNEAAAIDQAAGLNMHPISIRLPVELISQMKEIAEHHGIGYQPLIRDVIQRWAVSELSAIYDVRASKARKRKIDMEKGDPLVGGTRKRA